MKTTLFNTHVRPRLVRLIVSGVVTVAVPRAFAEMCAMIWAGTNVVPMEKFVLLLPAGTVTVPEAGAKNGWSDRTYTVVANGITPFIVTVQMVVLPAMTGFGLQVMATTDGSIEVMFAVLFTPL